MPTSERVRLHRRAAEAIEEAYAGHLEPHLFDLARHWAVAAVEGDAATAAGWIQRAAEEAMRGLAFGEAARLFRLALEVGGANLDEAARCRLLLGVGRALHASADVDGRLDACLQAAAVGRRIARPDPHRRGGPDSRRRVRASGVRRRARRLCEEAMAALDPAHIALRSRVTARFAEACMYLRDEESAGRTQRPPPS